MASLGFTVNCGTTIIDKCKDLQIPWGEDWTFQMLLGDLIDAAQMLVKYGVKYIAADASENMMKGINSLRCMLDNIGSNAWNMIAGAYWGLIFMGYEEDVKSAMDVAYNHVCTCQEDAHSLTGLLGKMPESEVIFTSCSEFVVNKKIDFSEKREEFVAKKKAANEKAIQQAAQNKRKQEAEGKLKLVLQEEGDQGLEKITMEKFNEYKKIAETISKKNIISQTEKDQLAKAKLEYMAAQEGKMDLMKKNLEVKVLDWVKNGKSDSVVEEAEEFMLELDQATSRQEEFPEDEEANVDAELAESKVKALEEVVGDIVKSDRLGVKDTKTFSDIKKKTSERRAYNRLYHEAKEYQEKGEVEVLEGYFEAIKDRFTAAEKKYEEAKKTNKNEKEVGEEFEKTMNQYNAALNVRFDLEEHA
jgi:hypothetical protein